MKRTNASKHTKFAALLAGAALLGLVSQSALAVGTISGASITNTATLNYSVGAVPQTLIESSQGGNTVAGTGNGSPTSFTVDAKVDHTLVTDMASVSVTPGGAKLATPFTLTNMGNATVAYTLAVTDAATGNHKVLGTVVADAFDTTIPTAAPTDTIYVDTNNNGTLDGTDVAVTAATANVLPGGVLNLIVVRDIPVSALNGQYGVVGLTATVVYPAAGPLEVGETAITGTAGTAVVDSGATVTGGVDVVLADAETQDNPLALPAGVIDGPANAARNGQVAAYGAYLVASAVISVQKTVTLLCDPFNGNTNPKNIPGSTVQYAIIISNAATASASATLSTIGDALNANTTFEPNLVTAISLCKNAEVRSQSLSPDNYREAEWKQAGPEVLRA